MNHRDPKLEIRRIIPPSSAVRVQLAKQRREVEYFRRLLALAERIEAFEERASSASPDPAVQRDLKA